jgi:DNA (cytosine-5)-methyltransferase 1
VSGSLVLSLFPGIGLLDMAFEEEGFCVVRGPDLLWGGDVRRFHPPAGRFDGVIGGPPCKAFSPLANVNRARYGEECIAENLIPEFERVVSEAHPKWFVMENVARAPVPSISGYCVDHVVLNNRWFGGAQNRERRFTFGAWWPVVSKFRSSIPAPVALETLAWEPAVCASVGGRRKVAVMDANGCMRGKQGRDPRARLGERSLSEMAVLQGLPANFLEDAPFTQRGKAEAIGNGVPLTMGRAIARAVNASVNEPPHKGIEP